MEFVPDASKLRAAIVARRAIAPGEELFAEYGAWYWDTQPGGGAVRLSEADLAALTAECGRLEEGEEFISAPAGG